MHATNGSQNCVIAKVYTISPCVAFLIIPEYKLAIKVKFLFNHISFNKLDFCFKFVKLMIVFVREDSVYL